MVRNSFSVRDRWTDRARSFEAPRRLVRSSIEFGIRLRKRRCQFDCASFRGPAYGARLRLGTPDSAGRWQRHPLETRNADGPKRHNSLGTISLAALRLCVSPFSRSNRMTEINGGISRVVTGLKNWLTQSRKEEVGGAGMAGDSRITKRVTILRQHRRSVTPALFLERTT